VAAAHARRSLTGALDGYVKEGVFMTKPATHMASILLAAVSIGHLLRALFGVQVTLADRLIPMWVSWAAFVVAGGVAVMLWREARNKT